MDIDTRQGVNEMSKSNMRKYAEKKIGRKLSPGEYYTFLFHIEGMPFSDIALLEGVPLAVISDKIADYAEENPEVVDVLRESELLELGRMWRNNYTPEIKAFIKKQYHADDTDVEIAKQLFEKFVLFCYSEGLKP